MVEILSNLKGRTIRMLPRHDATLTRRKKGQALSLAPNSRPAHDVEIVNPGKTIAYLTNSCRINLNAKHKARRDK